MHHHHRRRHRLLPQYDRVDPKLNSSRCSIIDLLLLAFWSKNLVHKKGESSPSPNNCPSSMMLSRKRSVGSSSTSSVCPSTEVCFVRHHGSVCPSAVIILHHLLPFGSKPRNSMKLMKPSVGHRRRSSSAP